MNTHVLPLSVTEWTFTGTNSR